MEVILYVTGGIALLALAWMFVSLASTFTAVRGVLKEAQNDLHTITGTVDELRGNIAPILDNVNGIASKVNSIAGGLQTQMLSVHETIDDSLDVVRGTIDDIERIKDQLVATVEGPLGLVRTSTDGAVGAVMKSYSLLKKFVSKKKDISSDTSLNGFSITPDKDISKEI